jgi:acetaldehyde dehydrogenase (acetylating)
MFREHGSDAVTYRVEASEPPRRRVVRIADANLPYGGTWTYELTPAAAGTSANATANATANADAAPLTQVTITERGEVYNPIFRFMSRFVFSHHATIDAYLTALGKRLGEPVSPENASTR